MKLLLDESVPRQLGRFFPETFEVLTVQKMGWTGRGNGELRPLVPRVVDVVTDALRRRVYRIAERGGQ